MSKILGNFLILLLNYRREGRGRKEERGEREEKMRENKNEKREKGEEGRGEGRKVRKKESDLLCK